MRMSEYEEEDDAKNEDADDGGGGGGAGRRRRRRRREIDLLLEKDVVTCVHVCVCASNM